MPKKLMVLALVAAFIFRFGMASLGGFFYNSLIIFTAVNVGLFVFNMIPFPPLDGSRLLYAFAPRGLQEVMQNICRDLLGSLVNDTANAYTKAPPAIKSPRPLN